MVLTTNSKLLISEFNRQRCIQKNEVKEILMRMKYEKDSFTASEVAPSEPDTTGLLKKGSQNTGVPKINTDTYECKKKEYNTAMYDLDTKYGYR